MRPSKVISCLTLAASLCLFAFSSAQAERKVRVHFVAASFSYARDTAGNSQLNAASSRVGYDAVWETTVEEGFPFFWPKPVVRNASGYTQQTVKFGNGNCEGNLQFDPDSNRFPNVNVYFQSENLVAVKISAAHGVSGLGEIISSDQPSPCDGALFITYAPGEGVTESFTPSRAGLPNEPNATIPPSPTIWAAFTVDPRDPGKVVNFSYVQTANFTNYESKSVWFGFVRVEVDPGNGTPSPVDPLRLFNYTPPENGQPPADPPSPNGGGGGNGGGGPESDPITPKEITSWIKDPIVTQIRDALQALQQVWNSLTGGTQNAHRGRRVAALYSDPSNRFTYDRDTRQLTLLSVSDAPGDGTASIKLGVNDGALRSAAKKVGILEEVEQQIVLTLPKALEKAFNKGKRFPLQIAANFTSSGNKKKKGAVTRTITVKKRKA